MADEQTNEDRIGPVHLPAGSFDVLELRDGLDKAVSVKDREQHPERINKAIAACIVQPEILAALDAPAVPMGASLVEQPITYVEGQKPVVRESIAFDPVEAEDGTEAAGMHYETRVEKKGETVVATDEPVGRPVEDASAPATLSQQAAEHVADSETGAAGSAKGK